MTTRGERLLAVLGASAVLVLGLDAITYAATGSSLILGAGNREGRVTTVRNTGPGAALALVTSSTAAAPFTTNATGKVVHLNSDLLDGLSAAQIVAGARTTTATQYVDGRTARPGDTRYELGSIPGGTYEVTLSAVVEATTAGTTTAPQRMYCQLDAGPYRQAFARGDSTVTAGSIMTPGFQTAHTFSGDEDLEVSCVTGTHDGWSQFGPSFYGTPVTLTLTRLDGATRRTM